jgi:hypothetical protein
MKAILVVAADRRVFRAFRRRRRKQDSQAHLEPFLESTFEEQAAPAMGRFPKAGPTQTVPGDMSWGEQHNYEREQRRRALATWAHQLEQLLAGAEFKECWLAVAQRVHQQLLDQLPAATRQKIRRLVPLDLARTPAQDVLSHFE